MGSFNTYGRKETTTYGGTPVWLHVSEKIQVGGSIQNSLSEGDLIPAGSPVEIDTEAHTAKILRAWEVVSYVDTGTNDVAVIENLPNSQPIKAGDIIMAAPSTAAGTGTGTAVISATVVATGTEIEFTADALGALSEGDIIVECSEAGATKAAYAIPNALTENDVFVEEGDTYYTCAGVIGGKVYDKRIPTHPTYVNALVPGVFFDNSY